MLGAGAVINPIIKIVTTVAVLAAIYFFIVKPVLDTTETVSSGFNESLGGVSKSVNKSIKQANEAAAQQGAGTVTFESEGLSPKQADTLLKCVQNAGGDVNAIQACNDEYAK